MTTSFPGRKAMPGIRTGLILGALVLAFPAVLRAQEPPPVPRLAVVDMEETMRGSRAGKALVAELEALVKQKREEMAALEREARDIRSQAAELAKTGGERQMAELQRKFNDKTTDMRRYQEEANQEIARKRVEVLSAFNRRVMPLIQSLGREQGVTLIFRKDESGLLYVDAAVDLTRQVIQRLDAAR